ncbi:type II secretion system protein [Phenylobacterium sp.]|uniref:type II secretion system protein n=1 Tax=Phenylobacterium sp. TaxID=1871053 RepID=UPI0027166352|nr:prepilin-type N-terminal cleavage/methylation domain-containing protein [Phenylobacterium sp.]MDO8381018.1 prepilin-type N-terminal cleavage/methylation domain-containing protein [Phenylobacterium sp.]
MKNGFSLVELSIVLVILGLLTGGVLAGKSLIRASELRAVTTEYNRYVSATYSFRDKYFGLPGDFRDATRFWGRQTTNTNCVSNSGVASATTDGVCDGNGNGLLAQSPGLEEPGEMHQFWRQLSAAGLVEGTYTGLAAPASYCPTCNDWYRTAAGVNVPASKFPKGGWSAFTYNVTSQMFDPLGGTHLFIGNNGHFSSAGIMPAADAWNIDTKMDDGKPATGKVATWKTTMNACASSDTQSAEYLLSSSSTSCALIFRNVF